MSSEVDVQAILSKAADLLEERGWGQGLGSGPDRNYCLVAAIDNVAPTRVGADEAIRYCKAQLRLSDQPDTIIGSLIRWNDDPSRTLPEVLAVLRAGEVGR